jgi:hypothetical protein
MLRPRVNRWIERQVTVRALDEGHRAGFSGRQTALDVPAATPSIDGVHEGAHHLPLIDKTIRRLAKLAKALPPLCHVRRAAQAIPSVRRIAR